MRLAIDIGARFVDMVAWGAGAVRHCKEPVGADLIRSVRAGLATLDVAPAQVSEVRIASSGFLNHLLHAGTVRHGPKVGLIATAGLEDVAALGRQDRIGLFDPVARVATPMHLIDDAAIFGVSARMDARGRELAPVDPADIDRIAEALRARGTSAVAICLLHAHVDGRHEDAVATALSVRVPQVSISLSHRVDPQPREFERTVSTVVDAWLRLTVLPELAELEGRFAADGFSGRWAWGDGRGILSDTGASLVPWITAGPAASIRGTAALADVACGDAIAIDIGSRSSDLALVRSGTPATIDGGILAGLSLRDARIDIESVPVGGAQPVPGQVRYTLDDALIAAGVLDEETDCPAEAAPALLAAAIHHLAEAITRHATRRNVDPTRARLVVTGGAGMLLAPDLADALGLAEVFMPHLPSHAGAMGLARAPRRREIFHRLDAPLAEMRSDRLAEFARASAEGLGPAPVDGAVQVFARISPRPRMPSLNVGFDAAGPATLGEAYRTAYLDRYGIAPQGPGHVTLLRAECDDRTGALGSDVQPEGSGMPPVREGWQAARVPGGWRLERGGR